jgi:hypothetical protein
MTPAGIRPAITRELAKKWLSTRHNAALACEQTVSPSHLGRSK